MASESQFGSFFRQRRKKLGLSQTEFCRQNGFDKGNISKLETGKKAPPKATRILESYAQALGLPAGSRDYARLIELAMAETGRLPAHLAGSRAVQDQIPQVIRQLAGRGEKEAWTKARDLEIWAGFVEAPPLLPRLIRSLIHATVEISNLEMSDMPYGEGIRNPGWDGIVKVTAGNVYVPNGVSVWELSTETDPSKKAEDEFQKRTKNTLGIDSANATFIFVTPRKWKGKSETDKRAWCRKKSALGIWRDVRVFDSGDLEAWLENAPGVDAWMAAKLGKRPPGVIDLDEHWQNLQTLATPPLRTSVFLASRTEARGRLKSWLFGPASSLAVLSQSPNDVVDFITAFVLHEVPEPLESDEAKVSLTNEERWTIVSRAVIVTDLDDWRGLASLRGRLVLIPHPGLPLDEEMVAEAVRNGHHVLSAINQLANPRSEFIELPRPFRHELDAALRESERTPENAAELIRECGGSLSVLKRRISRFAASKIPSWVSPLNAAELAPFLLIGAWDDDHPADHKIVEQVTGRPYRDALTLANRWLKEPDPPLTHNLTRWRLVSRDDSWDLLAKQLTEPQLREFEAVAQMVLSEGDPGLDLPAEERWLANLKQLVPQYSGVLRKGIAESLALLGAKGVSDSHQLVANRVVRQLLADADWKRWAYLSDELPILAEAAPDVFLDCVDTDLRRDSPELPRLFEDTGHPLFSRCLQSGLLWALEGLAWSRDQIQLDRVARLLARLAKRDSGGQWLNRPINSLTMIFLPWYPQNTVGVKERLAVLKHLLRESTDVGWKLLVSLLGSVQHADHNHRPRWRPWMFDWKEGSSRSEYHEQVRACAEMVVENTEGIERWEKVLDELKNLPPSAFERLIVKLNALPVQLTDDDVRRRMTDCLRKAIQRHRDYSDAFWAIPREWTDQLEAGLNQLEPQSLVQRQAWLFKHWVDFEGSRGMLYQEQQDFLLEKRTTAIQEIMREAGLPGLFDLAAIVEAPGEVGYLIGKLHLAEDADVLPLLFQSEDSKKQSLAWAYCRFRFAEKGWAWVDQLAIETWPASHSGILLATIAPLARNMWERAEQLGPNVTSEYWQRARVLGAKLELDELPRAVKQLIAFDRVPDSIWLVEYEDRTPGLSAELLMDVLDSCLTWSHAEPDRKLSDDHLHGFREIFATLQKRLDQLSPEEMKQLAQLEWRCLDLLDGYGGQPLTLIRWLSESPEFFRDLITWAYPPTNEEADSESDKEQRSKTFKQAHKLLMIWKRVPGTQPDGSIDATTLRNWVNRARSLCRDTDRLDDGDYQIGEVFAHGPIETDGTQPCVAIRDVIEEAESESLERGLSIGIRNKRGAYMKSPTGGGEQERDLAAKFDSDATACMQEWPRTATLLRDVAKGYESDARREDALMKERF